MKSKYENKEYMLDECNAVLNEKNTAKDEED